MTAVGYTGGDPNKVDVAGDTMTGPLVLPGDPSLGLQAATKDYVDTHGGGGGGGTPSGTVVSETSYGQTATAGVATAYSRGDHSHGSPALGSTGTTAAAGNHNHNAAYDALGAAATAQANALAADVPLGSATPSAVSITAAGAAGAGTSSSRQDHTHAGPGFGAVVTETAFGQSATNGVASTVARSDHSHGTPTAPTVPSASSSVVAETSFGIAPAAGAAATFSRGDHTHGTPTAPAGAAQLDHKAAIFGLKLATLGPYEMGGSPLGLSPGTLITCRVWVPSAMTLTKLGTWMQAAGITSSGVNGMAIYDAAGNLLDQTGDMSTQLASANQYVEGTLGGSVNLTANTSVHLAILAHFSGGNPTISGKAITGTNFVAINGVRPSVYLTGQASFPSTIDYASAIINDAAYCFYAR